MPSSERVARGQSPTVLPIIHVVMGLPTLVMLWLKRVRTRRMLAELEDRTLHDTGLSRADVDREAGKPFWRA